MRDVKYLSYVIRHKWWVLYYGIKIGAPLRRLLLHDMSKFLPAEWVPYRDFFDGPQPPSAEVRERFMAAVKLHKSRNPHHWEWWIRDYYPGGVANMTEPYLLELLADWCGAGRAINGKADPIGWYTREKEKIIMAPETRARLEAMLWQHKW
jgi:hypothetical protein